MYVVNVRMCVHTRLLASPYACASCAGGQLACPMHRSRWLLTSHALPVGRRVLPRTVNKDELLALQKQFNKLAKKNHNNDHTISRAEFQQALKLVGIVEAGTLQWLSTVAGCGRDNCRFRRRDPQPDFHYDRRGWR